MLKAVVFKSTNLLTRLCFYCLGFIDVYYCFKYLIIYPEEVNEDASSIDCLKIALIQFSYWIFTVIAEQISNKFNIGLWDLQYFERKRTSIKVYILIYIICTMAMCYIFINSFFDPQYSDQFNFNTADKTKTFSKVIYGIELAISIIISAHLIYIYRRQKRPQDQSQIRDQLILGNLDSINSNENDHSQQQQQQQQQQEQQQQLNQDDEQFGFYVPPPPPPPPFHQEQQQHGNSHLDQSLDFQDGRFLYDQNECIICQIQYSENDRIKELPCHHIYHKDCINQYNQRICPVCRKTY